MSFELHSAHHMLELCGSSIIHLSKTNPESPVKRNSFFLLKYFLNRTSLSFFNAFLKESYPFECLFEGTPILSFWDSAWPGRGQAGVMLGPSWPMLGLVWTRVALCWPRLEPRWLMLAQAETMLDLCWRIQAFPRLPDANPQWHLAPG